MKKCGIVKMINPYQIYNFKQPVGSSKIYENIFERKQFHKDEENKKWGEVRKNMAQYLLFCAKRENTSVDVQERIKYNIRPQDVVLGSTSVENSS